jgi:hypothetical protein
MHRPGIRKRITLYHLPLARCYSFPYSLEDLVGRSQALLAKQD